MTELFKYHPFNQILRKIAADLQTRESVRQAPI